MNKKAKNEFITLVVGLVVFVVGTALFLSKARVTSDFLSVRGIWTWWKVLLVFVPIVAGIFMMIVKPHFIVSKILAFAGVLTIIVVLFLNTTIIIVKDIATYEWIIYILCMVGGAAASLWALFVKGRKHR